jgi:mono/diheme cytochrome c family protein
MWQGCKPWWQRKSPIQRIFAALGVFLGTIAVVCATLIAIEIEAARAYSTRDVGLKDLKIPPQSVLEQGAYLAKVGNCAACHTARGGAAFAGGKVIQTPFGAVYTSNITPHATGIGGWSAEAFYRALHEGRSADGHMLAPAFPYPNYTHINRADADALHAYFMHSVAPVQQVNRAHDLRFPYNTRVALAVWRLLFFEAADPVDTTKNIAAYAIDKRATGQNDLKVAAGDVQRGAYLVRGLGHCSACHAQRNALGATVNQQLLSGALMPMQDWYAPSLMAAGEAGVQHWPRQDVVRLLQAGVSPQASVAGPMAEVVAGSTQYWRDDDLQAAAAYLQSLPSTGHSALPAANELPTSPSPPVTLAAHTVQVRGQQLFAQHCATCHGTQGQGAQVEGHVALPALAANRAVTMRSTANLVRIILAGGYAPSTAGNPRPYGMPPFVHVLSDEDIAAVTTYIRQAWGNQAAAVTAAEVVRHRQGLLQ